MPAQAPGRALPLAVLRVARPAFWPAGMLAIPGVGPVVAAGWLVATAVGAVAGGAAGAAVGGITGTFVAAGIDESDADFYAETIRRGGTVVTASLTTNIALLPNKFSPAGRPTPSSGENSIQDAGWKSFDASAPAYAKRN